MLDFILEPLKVGLILTLSTVGIYYLFGMIIYLLNLFMISCSKQKKGRWIYNLYEISHYIGTPIHEFGHYIMCKLFRVKVTEVRLFIPKSERKDNVLGYVKYQYNNKSLINKIGLFFISMGPLIVGSLIIILLSLIFMPDILREIYNSLDDFNLSVIMQLFFSKENILRPGFFIFLIISFCISIDMKLSFQDIKVSLQGLVIIFILNILISIIIVIFKIDITALLNYLEIYNCIMACILSIGAILLIFINVLLIAILLILTIFS